MYAIGLRHSRDADPAALDEFARAGALAGTPGRTGRGRPDRFGYRSGARAGAYVVLPGSRGLEVGPGT